LPNCKYILSHFLISASSDTLSEDAEYNEKRPVAKKRKKSYESYPPPTPASTTTCIDDTENDYLDKDGDTDSDAALVIKGKQIY